MISITTKSPYALRALAELARIGGPGPVPIGELARRRDIPVQFLEQLFAVLRRAGILRSQRGVKGGYAFAREPSAIPVLEIVELLDGPVGGGAEGIFSEAAAAAAPCWPTRRSPTWSSARTRPRARHVLHLTRAGDPRQLRVEHPLGARRRLPWVGSVTPVVVSPSSRGEVQRCSRTLESAAVLESSWPSLRSLAPLQRPLPPPSPAGTG
jgi:Rrf2 family protein